MTKETRLLVKVCGLRDSQNIGEIVRLGVDWIGMIFWPRSKRYVATPPTPLPDSIRRIGVFVDASLEDVRQHTDCFLKVRLWVRYRRGKDTTMQAATL